MPTLADVLAEIDHIGARVETLKGLVKNLDLPTAPEPEPPGEAVNLLPEKLRSGNSTGNWQTVMQRVTGLKAGQEYVFSAEATVTNYTSIAVWVDKAQIEKVNKPAGTPFRVFARFTANGESHELRVGGGGDGTGRVSWRDGKLLAAGATEQPPVDPPPVVDPNPDPVDPPPSSPSGLPMFVNVAGAEFNSKPVGTMNTDYIYASNSDIDKILALAPWDGIRLPFKWTRLQRELYAPLNAADVKELDRIVAHVTGKGLIVMLDSHDYGRRGGEGGGIIGQSGITAEHYAQYFGLLAERYKGNDLVWYNSNEPHDQDWTLWNRTVQKLVDAIRKAGAKGKAVFPLNNWAGAHSFVGAGRGSSAYETNPIRDPLNNFAIDVHQYFDDNSAGDDPGTSAGAGKRADTVIAWAKKVGAKLFLGEFGYANTPEGHAAAETILRALADSGVCVGTAYWASGPWWKPDDWNIIGPKSGNGQLTTLKKFM